MIFQRVIFKTGAAKLKLEHDRSLMDTLNLQNIDRGMNTISDLMRLQDDDYYSKDLFQKRRECFDQDYQEKILKFHLQNDLEAKPLLNEQKSIKNCNVQSHQDNNEIQNVQISNDIVQQNLNFSDELLIRIMIDDNKNKFPSFQTQQQKKLQKNKRKIIGLQKRIKRIGRR